jgi:hypothetical protein
MYYITKIMLTLISITLIPLQYGFSQQQREEYFAHDFSFGVGYAYGFEKDVFNVPQDAGINSAPAINLNYLYFLNPNVGIGARAFGFVKTLPEYTVISPTGKQEKIKYELLDYNFDAEFRYAFHRGVVEPYGFLLLGLASGTVTHEEEKLSFTGFNAGAGAGLRIPFAKRWRISIELYGTVGSAKWEMKPFLNSTGDDFNPSMAGVLLNFSYLWGYVKSYEIRKK